MPYPNTDDVSTYAVSIGLDAEVFESYDFEGEIAQAVGEFEERTERRGFQSGATLTYTGDGPDWRSRPFLWRIPDFSAITDVSYNGVTLTQGSTGDYLLVRWREDDPATPYTGIKFLTYQGEKPEGYTVTGTRGYGDCPDDVNRAIVQKALALYLSAPLDGQTGAVSREKIGAREVEYDLTSGRDSISRMVANFDACVKRYTRWL